MRPGSRYRPPASLAATRHPDCTRDHQEGEAGRRRFGSLSEAENHQVARTLSGLQTAVLAQCSAVLAQCAAVLAQCAAVWAQCAAVFQVLAQCAAVLAQCAAVFQVLAQCAAVFHPWPDRCCAAVSPLSPSLSGGELRTAAYRRHSPACHTTDWNSISEMNYGVILEATLSYTLKVKVMQ